MHMVMRPPRQPVFNDGGFVGGVIVHDNMNVEAVRNLRINLLEKVEKLGGSGFRMKAGASYGQFEGASDCSADPKFG